MTAEYHYFATYEARERAFADAVGDLLPARHRGARRFWEDFRRMAARLATLKNLPAYITGNPRDGLVFSTPQQELTAAGLRAGRPPAAIAEMIAAHAERFALTATLAQPMRTLSGGETVRLALAKALITEPSTARLVVASPFCWLSDNHRPLLGQVADAYDAAHKPVHILAMRGENDATPMGPHWLAAAPLKALPFSLVTHNLRIVLGLPVNTLTAEPATTRVQDACLDLRSPCLLTAANGQGKSLLAKALSGAAPTNGLFRLQSAQAQGRARLLFQDVVTQTLLRRPSELADDPQDPRVRDCLMHIHNTAERLQRCCDPASGEPWSRPAVDLPSVKAMLAAVRLLTRPAALILDEPDWGLTRSVALALVLAVVIAAHDEGVPVIIISHKPWWRPLAQSCLRVIKTPSAAACFDIRLENTS